MTILGLNTVIQSVIGCPSKPGAIDGRVHALVERLQASE
jgi:hypothetical protein